VVVPVYNPGPYLERCVDSVLAQSMAHDEFEAIFVDDGSTDGTPARLDALTAAHTFLRVIHQPNSGWPGKPRNVGIDAARGEYVFFLDNDDALGHEALERMHAMATRNRSDIVIGKMAGHSRAVPRRLFEANRDRATLADTPLIDSLTPHKMFRREFLLDHGIRFPEGRRRLEDHVFVVTSYFAAEVISVLADYVCYYHLARGDRSNASADVLDPPYYYGFVREVLRIVEANTKPGPERNRILQRFARVELLDRLRGPRFLGPLFLVRPRGYREALFAEVAAVVRDHIDPGVDEILPTNYRVRMALVRADRPDLLIAYASAEAKVGASAILRHSALVAPATLEASLEAGLAFGSTGIGIEDNGGAPAIRLPDRIARAVPQDARIAPGALSGTPVLVLRRRSDSAELSVPAVVTTQVVNGPAGSVSPRFALAVSLDLANGNGGAPVGPGTWDLVVRVPFLGLAKEATPLAAGGMVRRRLVIDVRDAATTDGLTGGEPFWLRFEQVLPGRRIRLAIAGLLFVAARVKRGARRVRRRG
jgi:glycosyltransferase involved in cell wall biosynthesis